MKELRSSIKEEVEEIVKHFPNKKAALLSVMRVVEREVGYIEEEECELVGKLLDLSPSYVYGFLTFYTHFKRRHHGKNRIMVCSTLMCALRGSKEVLEHLEDKLGLGVGDRSADGKYSLEKVECLASCDTAPVMQIDDKYHENLTKDKIDEILSKLE